MFEASDEAKTNAKPAMESASRMEGLIRGTFNIAICSRTLLAPQSILRLLRESNIKASMRKSGKAPKGLSSGHAPSVLVWLPGHLALGLLIALPLFLKMENRSRPLLLVQVAFFSAFPDFFHIGDIRMISHSLIGLAGLLVAALLFLSLFNRQDLSLILASIIGASSHLVGDAFIGHIYPFFPLTEQIIEFSPFNTLFDLQFEITLSLIALAALIALGIPRMMFGARDLATGETKQMLLQAFPLALLSAGEVFLYLITNMHRGASLTVWSLVPFFALPLVFFAALAIWALLRLQGGATWEEARDRPL